LRSQLTFLVDIRDRCQAVLDITTRFSKETMMSDYVVHEALVRNLEVIGEAAKSVSIEIQERHPEIPWKKIKRARDFFAHSYHAIDDDTIWDIATHDIPDLFEKIKPIIEEVEAEESNSVEE
jgi:uncharacterized protein with HEPN domain